MKDGAPSEAQLKKLGCDMTPLDALATSVDRLEQARDKILRQGVDQKHFAACLDRMDREVGDALSQVTALLSGRGST